MDIINPKMADIAALKAAVDAAGGIDAYLAQHPELTDEERALVREAYVSGPAKPMTMLERWAADDAAFTAQMTKNAKEES